MLINNIGVHIKAKDFKKSTHFYESLGFNKVFEYGPNKKVKEKYSGVVYGCGGAKLEIADGHVAVKPSVFREKINSSKISLMVNVDKLSNIIKLCKKSGIPIAVSPRHYYWGTLELVIKDPDGVILVFIAPYSKIEAGKIQAGENWSFKSN